MGHQRQGSLCKRPHKDPVCYWTVRLTFHGPQDFHVIFVELLEIVYSLADVVHMDMIDIQYRHYLFNFAPCTT